MKSVRFLRPAEMELLDAAQDYESQAPGLGKEFLGKIDNAVCDIGEALAKPPVHGSGRSPTLQKSVQDPRVSNGGTTSVSSAGGFARASGKNPERWPVVRNGVRRRFIHRFPDALLDRVDLHEAAVQAVMHLHRRPNYWLAR